MQAGGGERGECGGDSEVVKCGECVPEEASNVSAVVVVSAGRRGGCGGGGGERGPEGASKVSAVVVMMSAGRGSGDCVVVCGGVSSV